MKHEETFYSVEITPKDPARPKRLAMGAVNPAFGSAGNALYYWHKDAVSLKNDLVSQGIRARVVRALVTTTWLILFSAFQLFSFSAFSQAPPIPVPIKRPAKTTPAPTAGSGAATLLSVKAAAIPVAPQILLTWTPTNIVWTQSITILDISNGIPVAWLTNRWTNLWEIQERIDNGPWTITLVTNRPPAKLPRTSTGLHIFRIRSWWDP